ncbi:MAG: hypothetical protein AAGG09_18615 [Pseudomonadota bacterium]
MPLTLATRMSIGLVGLIVLGACSSEPQSAVNARAAPPPAELQTIDATDAQVLRLSREAQLQTPLDLPPEATGAPPPDNFHANGMDVGAPELQAGGVDISPDVRVWQRWPAGTRQIYGPRPSFQRPILTPVEVPTQ